MVGIDFDPMLAKVIAKAPTRREAALRLARALERTRIHGHRHQPRLPGRDPAHAGVPRGRHHHRLHRAGRAGGAARPPAPAAREAAAIAAAMHGRALRRAQARVLATIPAGFRNSVMPPQRVGYRCGEATLQVGYQPRRDGALDVRVDGAGRRVLVHAADAAGVDLAIDGQRSRHAVTRVGDRTDGARPRR